MSLKRERASKGDTTYTLRDGLLLFNGRLVVPDEGNLRTRLCNEFYRPSSRAYLGRNKMRKMVAERYFWPGLGGYIDRYCAHYTECRRSKESRQKPAGLL